MTLNPIYRDRKIGRVDDLSADSSEQKFGGDVDFASDRPNVVTSLYADVWAITKPERPLHLPVIDVDLPISAVESSTPGHFHLYIERTMTTESLWKLLDVMEKVGLVEPGYVAASKQRGYTTARLPWIKKGEPEPDVNLAPIDAPVFTHTRTVRDTLRDGDL